MTAEIDEREYCVALSRIFAGGTASFSGVHAVLTDFCHVTQFVGEILDPERLPRIEEATAKTRQYKVIEPVKAVAIMDLEFLENALAVVKAAGWSHAALITKMNPFDGGQSATLEIVPWELETYDPDFSAAIPFRLRIQIAGCRPMKPREKEAYAALWSMEIDQGLRHMTTKSTDLADWFSRIDRSYGGR